VEGTGKGFPEAKFIRTKTEFHEFLGPVGPGINPGEEIENKVRVKHGLKVKEKEVEKE